MKFLKATLKWNWQQLVEDDILLVEVVAFFLDCVRVCSSLRDQFVCESINVCYSLIVHSNSLIKHKHWLYICHKIEKSQRIWYEWKYWLMMILWRFPCYKLKSLVIKVFVKTKDKKHATIKKENPSTIKIPIKLMIQEDWNQDCHFPSPWTCIYIFCLMNSRIILFKVLYQTYEFHYQVF